MQKALLATALIALAQPAFANYDPAQITVSPEVGKWISSLYSEGGGRCCDEADALKDAYWESSATASSGYALIVQGRAVDVDALMMQIYTQSSAHGFAHVPVTDNLAGFPLAWIQSYVGVDDNGRQIIQFDANGAPEFRVRCLLPGGAF